MLPPFAILGRSRYSRCLGFLEVRSPMAFRFVGYLARCGILSNLSWDEMPNAAQQDCSCPLRFSGDSRRVSALLPPSHGRFACRHFKLRQVEDSDRTAPLDGTNVEQLRPVAGGVQRSIRRRAYSLAAFTHVNRMSAGGLRSSRCSKTNSRPRMV